MGLLELDRWDHPERAVEAVVVVPMDPAGGGVLDVGQGPERLVVEDQGADALGLVQAIGRLHERVVPRRQVRLISMLGSGLFG